MDFKIAHSLPGRIRIRYDRHSLTPVQAGLVKSLVEEQMGITSVEINPITGSVLIHYVGISEETVLAYFRLLDHRYLENQELLDSVNPLDIPQPSLFSILSEMVVRHYIKKLLPFPIRKALQLINIAPRLYNGAKSIVNGKVFCADVLDATALGFSYFSGDIKTAGSVSFLLSIGEVLEDYIKRKSYDNLAHSLLNTEEVVNVLTDNGQEIQVQTKNLKQGDRVICRIGGVIPADGEKTAQAVAREAGITEFYAQTLPDQKVAYVKQMKSEGRTVAMVGDGINDAPALSAADIGIAMGKASSIAGQTADIMLPDDGLSSLPKLMKIGRNLKRRIKGNNDAIIGVNSMLILGGLANVISPSLAALLHNASTVAISMSAMRRID